MFPLAPDSRAAGAAPGTRTLLADLADLGAVKAIAASAVNQGLPLDVLVNNAAGMHSERRMTKHGF